MENETYIDIMTAIADDSEASADDNENSVK